jgi:hypothetical protein
LFACYSQFAAGPATGCALPTDFKASMEPGVDPGAVFISSNVGGNLFAHFADHDDSAYANNPWGATMHL